MNARVAGCLFAALLLGPLAGAPPQAPCAEEDWGRLGSIGSKYDAKTVATLKGKVASLKRVSLGSRKGCYCLFVEVDDGSRTRLAYLGPVSYLRRKGYRFEVGTALELTGSAITWRGKELLVVKELKVGDEVWRIRDEAGRHL